MVCYRGCLPVTLVHDCGLIRLRRVVRSSGVLDDAVKEILEFRVSLGASTCKYLNFLFEMYIYFFM
jgi:hypothetical protein